MLTIESENSKNSTVNVLISGFSTQRLGISVNGTPCVWTVVLKFSVAP
jgi:hypothetical protein